MLTYATLAAGSPSDAAPMANHLLTQTLPQEVADLARYYTHEAGTGPDGAGPRPDMHPLVAQGLGIDATRELSRDEINALLAGRRADWERIESRGFHDVMMHFI